MARIGISQVPGSNPPQFLARNRDTEQSAPPAMVPSPYEWPVLHAGDDKLMAQLRWYLETFLSYPFEPYTVRAEHIEAALKAWGTAAFQALFDNLAAGQWIPHQADAVLDVIITCDDPHFLAWPWEALYFSQLGYFGHRARIQRRLSHDVPEPPALPELPRDRIHILLVTARPYGDEDVDYRSISRPLVDLIERERLPVSVQVLRPPTFENLRRHLLEEQPGHYHILHFDGHGGYGTQAPTAIPGQFRGSEGRLLFEMDDGSPDEVTAGRLATGLHGCTVPFVVLNACRSAQLDANAAEGRAFASVAGALVHAGFRGVLAMAYNLTVTGAQQFLPAFYRRLFRGGSLLEAAREGRLRMFDQASRSAWNPEVKLQDWLLPVVYQQREDFDLRFASAAAAPEEGIPLPQEATVPETLAFVGRDAAIHALERALRRPSASILVHGLGGVGKTTLARHFLRWLRDTGGLVAQPFWFSFDDIRSAAFVFNQIGRALFGAQFDSDQPQHYSALIAALREKISLFLVWDNFESARGFQPEQVSGLLSQPDQDRLRDFLAALRGGKTKVLITSRSDEPWLPDTHCRRLPLGGLQGEELWEFAAQVLDDLDLSIDRKDENLRTLLIELGGHPVLIRAVLPELRTQSAANLRQHWQANLPRFLAQVTDPAHARLLASLDLAAASFTKAERPDLIPLGLHERYVDLDYLHAMGKNGIPGYEPERMKRVVARLVRSGLLTGLGQNVFALHPLLTSYLRTSGLSPQPNPAKTEVWESAFVEVMARLADAVASKELHEQRETFALHHANFHRALELATSRAMPTPFAALTQSLAAYALNTRNWPEAFALFERLAERRKEAGNPEGEAAAYHQLGIIAEEQRDFPAAERWYLKSLAIKEKQGNELDAASTYHQLGRIAQEQRDFPTAERWYLKSLAISEKQGNEHYAASTYHQLGRIAQERRDFPAAERWYLKSLAINEKQGNEHGAAISYHQLGIIAQEQRDFPAAERWYLKSLAIKEKQGNEHGAASTYHQLGIIAQEQRDFPAAERWYLKSLAIKEKQGNEHGAAISYHQLGIIAQEQRDFPAAERWYLKSLAIKEKQGNEHGAASTYHQLGRIAQERGDYLQACVLALKASEIFVRKNDRHNAQITLGNFARLFRASPPENRAEIRKMGREALGDELMRLIEQAADKDTAAE